MHHHAGPALGAMLGPILSILFLMVFFAGAMGLWFFTMKRRRKAWSTFAAAHGLDFSDGGVFSTLDVTGSWNDVPISIRMEIHGSGKSRHVCTRVTASFRSPGPAGLHVVREGFLHVIGKALGVQDIQVGIPEVDKRLLIKGSDEAAIVALFRNASCRTSILSFFETCSSGTLTSSDVSILHHGFILDHAKLAQSLDATTSVVRNVEGGMVGP